VPNQRNQQIVSDLAEKLSKSQSVVFTTYTGLSVPLLQTLRQSVSKVGGEVTVAKNTLIKIAFEQAGLPAESLSLSGQTALVLGYEDPISPVKALFNFNKENSLPIIAGGYFEGSLLGFDDMEGLSKLPGQQEMYSIVVGTLIAPIRNFAGVCNGVLRDFVSVLNQLAEAKAQ